MAFVNANYLKLKAGYLFPEIARRVNQFLQAHPDAPLIRLGIGDVTEPLPAACRQAMIQAVEEMGDRATFKGYGPEQGYPWLREKIAAHDFQARGCDIDASEIFISDGSKCDTGNILDIFGDGNRIAVTDPVYPVYVDTNVMAGHTGEANERGEYAGLVYLPITAENYFTATLPSEPVDLIYLCFPNNPAGAVATREHLQAWVDYARAHKAIIFFDAAYEAFITDPAIPHSIYEIPGARECAIEFRSFSKNAGLREPAAPLRWCPRVLRGKPPVARPSNSGRCGNGGNPRSLMVCPTLCSGAPRRFTLKRSSPSTGTGGLLYGQCPSHSRKTHPSGLCSLWWGQCSLCLAEDAPRDWQLGLFR